MRVHRLVGGLLGALLVAGCADDSSPDAPEACGTAASGCGTYEHCDRVAAPPRCVCDEGYTGSSCSSCASGYTQSGGRCIPVAVSCQDGPCGTRGDCRTSSGGEDVCVCDEGYIGARCVNCADGYQDNDQDGQCEPACGVADLACTGRRTCSDATGSALCLCENGYVGDTCSDCAPGYREILSTHSCVPTCSELVCSADSTCVEGPTGAACECAPGWGGERCDECALGYSVTANGDCSKPIPLGTAFLTLVEAQDRQFLAAAVAPSFAVEVLVPIQGTLRGLAQDPAGSLYGLTEDALVRVDPNSGALTPLSTDTPLAAQSLTFDPVRQVVYAGSSTSIVSIDLADGAVTEVAPRGAGALAYDAEEDRLLAFEWSAGATVPARFDVDLTTSTVTERGPLADTTPLTATALALDPVTERPYLLGTVPETDSERLSRYCQDAAFALGTDASGSLVAGAFGETGDETLVLDDAGTDPRLVIYGSTGDASSAPTTLEVATRHPDAVVCIVTREQPLRVAVDAEARLRLLLLVTETNNVELIVPESYAPSTPTPIHVHVRGGSASLTVPAELGLAHDDAAWADLGLGYLTDGERQGTARLAIVDWESGASSSRTLTTPALVGALTAYPEGN